MFCPPYYSGLTNGAIIGPIYKVKKNWRSLWDDLIERPALCHIAGDLCILVTLITSFLPHSASLYFSSFACPESAKLASEVMQGFKQLRLFMQI